MEEKKKIIIIGAGGHGKVVADIAKKNGYDEIKFLDDNYKEKENFIYEVVGPTSDISKYKDYDAFVAIGMNNELRGKLIKKFEEEGLNIPTLVHPFTSIDETATIGKGTVVMAGAVINSSAKIGKGCIINTGSSVDHDNVIGDFVHISVGTHLAGTVKVGEYTFVGAGSTIINNINVTKDCMIGGGATVVKDIEESGTYIGVPARRK